MLARQGKYNDCLFHRLVPGFMVPISPAPSFNQIMLARFKQVTPLARVQVVDHIGKRHSVMSMI
jgi:hypothetical protein